jgi:hypothetical protein
MIHKRQRRNFGYLIKGQITFFTPIPSQLHLQDCEAYVRKDQKKLQGTENKFIRAVHSLTLDEKKW